MLLRRKLRLVKESEGGSHNFSFFLGSRSQDDSIVVIGGGNSLEGRNLFVIILHSASLEVIFLVFLRVFVSRFP